MAPSHREEASSLLFPCDFLPPIHLSPSLSLSLAVIYSAQYKPAAQHSSPTIHCSLIHSTHRHLLNSAPPTIIHPHVVPHNTCLSSDSFPKGNSGRTSSDQRPPQNYISSGYILPDSIQLPLDPLVIYSSFSSSSLFQFSKNQRRKNYTRPSNPGVTSGQSLHPPSTPTGDTNNRVNTATGRHCSNNNNRAMR